MHNGVLAAVLLLFLAVLFLSQFLLLQKEFFVADAFILPPGPADQRGQQRLRAYLDAVRSQPMRHVGATTNSDNYPGATIQCARRRFKCDCAARRMGFCNGEARESPSIADLLEYAQWAVPAEQSQTYYVHPGSDITDKLMMPDNAMAGPAFQRSRLLPLPAREAACGTTDISLPADQQRPSVLAQHKCH